MQLLVRRIDKVSTDPEKHRQLTKRGDVIAVKPDGAEWGTEELTNPEWVILSVPDLSEDEALALLVPERPPLDKPGAVVRKRLFHVDLDALPSGLVKVDRPRQRRHGHADEQLTAALVRSVKQQKA